MHSILSLQQLAVSSLTPDAEVFPRTTGTVGFSSISVYCD